MKQEGKGRQGLVTASRRLDIDSGAMRVGCKALELVGVQPALSMSACPPRAASRGRASSPRNARQVVVQGGWLVVAGVLQLFS